MSRNKNSCVTTDLCLPKPCCSSCKVVLKLWCGSSNINFSRSFGTMQSMLIDQHCSLATLLSTLKIGTISIAFQGDGKIL